MFNHESATPMVFSLLILAAVIVLPWVLLLIFGNSERTREHAERMRAMEHGVAPPAVRGARPFWQAVLVGAGVPLLVAAVALNIRTGTEMWHMVAALALLSAIPGTAILVGRPDTPIGGTGGKAPLRDADAYDTVSRRG